MIRYFINVAIRISSVMLLATVPMNSLAFGANIESDKSYVQKWEFITESGDIATTICDRGACTAKSWTLLSRETFGCTHKVDFDVQFSGKQVRLLLFKKTLDSDCRNTSTVGSGTGTANASYPKATRASGTVTLNTTSPIGPSGGEGKWTARRVS